MSARSRDIITATLAGAGIIGAGELFFACQASTNADGAYWKDWFDTDKYFAGNNSPSSALAAMTAWQNDVVLIGSAAMITTTASITWNVNAAHMVGMIPTAPGQRSGRARIGASGNFTPLITVSAQGCMFNNIHFMNGQGSTANENNLRVTGSRNMFKNCHIATYNATELDGASGAIISIGNIDGEIAFHDCYIGTDSVAMTAGRLVEFESGATVRSVWDNCNLVMYADTANPVFMLCGAGMGRGPQIFKNTFFINMNSSTALTLGMSASGLGNAQMYMDANSFFCGVTDVAAAAYETFVHFSPAQSASTDITGRTFTGRSIPFDHTSG